MHHEEKYVCIDADMYDRVVITDNDYARVFAWYDYYVVQRTSLSKYFTQISGK